MTRKPPSTSRADRRRFLHDVAAAAGLAAVAGTAAGSTPTATPAPANARAEETSGYRVTPHVAKYYAKARL